MDESLAIQRRLEQQQRRQEEPLEYGYEEGFRRALFITADFQNAEEVAAYDRIRATGQKKSFGFWHYNTLYPVRTAASPQARRPDMENKKERKAFYNAQKKKAKSNEDGLLSEEDVENIELLRQSTWGQKTWMQEKKKGSDFTQEELYQQALSGDFKDFEHLDEPLRNALASQWMRQNFVMPLLGQTPGEYVRNLTERFGVEGLMNPLFRLGISLAMRSGFKNIPKEFFIELDNKCCSEIMVMTLTKKVSQEEKERIACEHPEWEQDNEKARNAVERDVLRNQASQIFMAKNLLLMHMSRFSLKQKGKPDTDWPHDVAAAFGHCSRVSFILPPLKDSSRYEAERHRDMWQALRELRTSRVDTLKENVNSILFRRASSTHDFQRRKVNRENGGGEFQEKKKPFNLIGQEGANVAIGGLYSRGINGRPLLNDGSCGHIYFMKREGTTAEYGGYLIGFESDAYQKTNQLGHKHGFGNGEHASSFGGQRVDEIGDKYGGRVCDLGHIDPDTITMRMMQLERYMRVAMAEDADMTPVMRILAGRRMNEESLADFFRMIELQTAELESRKSKYKGNATDFHYRRGA